MGAADDDDAPVWCPEQQIYIGGVVPGLTSDVQLTRMMENNQGALRIFGYGSLCWKPGDGTTLSKDGVTRCLGRAVGWKRCWSQRSADHRGTPDFQGLVCTLLSDEEIFNIYNDKNSDSSITSSPPTMTEGIIYTVPPSLAGECLAELDFREKGGYSRDIINVVIDSEDDSKSDKNNDDEKNTVQALLYRGTPDNPAFWKRALMDLPFAAATMAVAVGPSGPNDEYLYNLDNFLSSASSSTHSGDMDTKRLANMCRELQHDRSLFFLYGSGSNQHGQLLLLGDNNAIEGDTISTDNSNQHHLLSDDGNLHSLTELVIATVPILGDNDVASKKPSTLYAGGGHSGMLLESGEFYLWGWNEYGQLGRGDLVNHSDASNMASNLSFPLVAPLQHINDNDTILVEKAALGHAHTLLIERRSGRLYAFGDNSRGQVTGIKNPASLSSKIPHMMTPESLVKEYFIDIATGLFHSAGINQNGELLTWGCQTYGQTLVTDSKDDLVRRWKPEDGSSLVKVTCGRRHTVMLDEHGRIWTMGDNKYGQLGRPTTGSNKAVPELVAGQLGRKGSGCFDISCGWSHCMALVTKGILRKNDLYGWGRNDKGQLGFNDKNSNMKGSVVTQPHQLDIGNDDDRILKFSCGAESSVVLLNNDNNAAGTLWACGWNEHGNLSTGDTDDVLEWKHIVGTKISSGPSYSSNENVVFSSGGGHMLAMMT